jgi:hypothetical protein
MTPRNKKEMRPDPLIDEIRAIRKALHDEMGGDVAKLAEYANQVAKKYRARSPRTSRSRSSGKK